MCKDYLFLPFVRGEKGGVEHQIFVAATGNEYYHGCAEPVAG